MGRILVSWCRWWVFVSATHPVAILRAEFCIIWSFLRDVSLMVVDQEGFEYSRMGRVMALYVWVMVSMDLPHLVVVRDLMMLRDFLAFSAVFAMCLLKVSLGSKVMPRIFGFGLVGIRVLFMG